MDDKDDAAAKKIAELREIYGKFVEDVIKQLPNYVAPDKEQRIANFQTLRSILTNEKRLKITKLLKIEQTLKGLKAKYDQKNLPLNVLRQVKQEHIASIKMENDRIQSPESPPMVDDRRNASNEPINIPTERKGSKNYSYDGNSSTSSNYRRSQTNEYDERERNDYQSRSKSHNRHQRDRRSRTPERRHDYNRHNRSSRDYYGRDYKNERDSRDRDRDRDRDRGRERDRDRDRDYDSYRSRGNYKSEKYDENNRGRERSNSRYRNLFAPNERPERIVSAERQCGKSVFGRLGAKVEEANEKAMVPEQCKSQQLDAIDDDLLDEVEEGNEQRFGKVDEIKELAESYQMYQHVVEIKKLMDKESQDKMIEELLFKVAADEVSCTPHTTGAEKTVERQTSSEYGGGGDDVPLQRPSRSPATVPHSEERIALKYNPKPRKRFDSNDSSSPNTAPNAPSSTYTPTAAAASAVSASTSATVPQFDPRLRTNNRDPRSITNGPVLLPNSNNCHTFNPFTVTHLPPVVPTNHLPATGPPHHLPPIAPSHHMLPVGPPHHLPPIAPAHHMLPVGPPPHLRMPIVNPPANYFMSPIRQPMNNHFNETQMYPLHESNQFAMHSPPVGPPFHAEHPFYSNAQHRRFKQTYADHKRELEKKRECVSSTTNSSSAAVTTTSTAAPNTNPSENFLVTTTTTTSPPMTSPPAAISSTPATPKPASILKRRESTMKDANKDVNPKPSAVAPKTHFDNAFRGNNWEALKNSGDNRIKKGQFKIPKLQSKAAVKSSMAEKESNGASAKSGKGKTNTSDASKSERSSKDQVVSQRNGKRKPPPRRKSTTKDVPVPTSTSSPQPITEMQETSEQITSSNAPEKSQASDKDAPKAKSILAATSEPIDAATSTPQVIFGAILTTLLQPNNEEALKTIENLLDAEQFQHLTERLCEHKMASMNGDDTSVSSSTTPILTLTAEKCIDAMQQQPQPEPFDNENENETEDKSKPTKRAPKKNELQRLQENLENIFIRDDVLTATGTRLCTIAHRQKVATAKKVATSKAKGAIDSDTSSEASSVVLPPPAAARVLRRRNTTVERHIRVDVNYKENDDDDDNDRNFDDVPRIRLPNQPKRITRRRDTFCEVIDTPERGDGSQPPIKIKITTNKAKQAIDGGIIREIGAKATMAGKRLSTASDKAGDKNAKKPKLSVVSPPKISSRPVLSRECKVVLEKLDSDGLKRARNHNNNRSDGDDESDSGSTKALMNTDAKRLKRIYNTDKSMHSGAEPMTCALCSATPRFIIHHYVNEHDGYEVCHARMPPETTESLRTGNSMDAVHETNNKTTALCHYCEKMRTFGRADWIQHITRHTGEYMRYCKKCNLKCADSKFKSTSQCPHDDVAIWNKIVITGTALGVFVCKLCNYSQLQEANVEKHLREMHKVNKNTSNYYDFIALIPNMRKGRAPRIVRTADTASEASTTISEQEPANADVFKTSEQDDGLLDNDTIKLMKETTFKESSDDAPAPSTSFTMTNKLSERFRKQNEISEPKPEIEKINVAMECPEHDSKGIEKRNPLATDSSSPVSENTETANEAGTAAIDNTADDMISIVEMKPEASATASSGVATNANYVNDAANEMNSESDENGWESCTGSEESDNDDASVAYESQTKNKMIASTLSRLCIALKNSKPGAAHSQTLKKKTEQKSLSTSREANVMPVKVEEIKTEDVCASSIDVSKKSIKCVENVGFSEFMGSLEFICFIEKCNYQSSELLMLLNHVREHTQTWSGICLLCIEKVANPSGALSLTKEVNHLKDHHLPIIRAANEESALPSTPPADVVTKPIIKCRRVSGDRLSTLKSEITLPASIPSIPSIPSIISRSGSTNENVLKPWTTCPLSKSINATQHLQRDVSLVALFKCMGINCYFSTGEASKMLEHLHYHEDHVSKQQQAKNEHMDHLSWLECSYCDALSDTCSALVDHVRFEHESSIYQCPYCFYRSVAAANVETHLNEYHSKRDKMIMQCIGTPKQLHAQIDFLQAEREKNVLTIKCGDEGCNFSCKSYAPFEYHLQNGLPHRDKETSVCSMCSLSLKKSNLLKHLQTHHIAMFQCIYCLFGCNSVKFIRLHLTNFHSNELPYSVMRSRSTLADESEPNNTNATCMVRASIESNQKLLFMPPLTVRQMNFMRPEITDDAIEFNAGYCPSDDGPSMEKEIRDKLNSTNECDQDHIQEIERQYKIVSAEQMLKVIASASPPRATPNLVITSVRSIPMHQVNVAKPTPSPVKLVPQRLQEITLKYRTPTKLTLGSPQAIPSTSKGVVVMHPPMATAAVPTKTGETTLTISHVAGGVEFKDAVAKPTVQSEIDSAARSLVKGTGFEGQELYRCGVAGCSMALSTDSNFMLHVIAQHKNVGKFMCVHCGNHYDKAVSLKNHIKVHGIHRYFCFCCNKTAALLSLMQEHFTETHGNNANHRTSALQTNDIVTYALNENHMDSGKDMFVVCPRGITDIKAFGVNLVSRQKKLILSTKKFYMPAEASMLPQQSIFPDSVACKLCGYSSKMRCNIVRHLQKADCVGLNVPGTDPVNPVPCLNSGEKHFDKMRNLAASSNANDSASIKLLEQRLKYMPDDRRYVCGASTCHYQTQTEEMLRSHIDTLHAGDQAYHCPHCNCDLSNGKAIVAADVLNHLRFHDTKLFKCPACPFFHYLKPTVDKHMTEMHPRCKDLVNQIRRIKPVDTSKMNKTIVVKWKCNVCPKATFDSRLAVRTHLADHHRLNYQYQCINCSYQNDVKGNVKEHILSAHGSNDVGHVKTLYERVESDIDVTPIWRRDDPNRIKHIRGILVEESDIADDDDNFKSVPIPVTKLTKATTSKPKLLNGTKLFTQSKCTDLGDDAQLVVLLKGTVKNETEDSTPPRQRLLLSRAAKNR